MAYEGAQQNAAAQKASADYQAQVAGVNAKVAQQNAQAATQQGEFNATQASMKAKAQIGAIAAQQGANGLDINSGTNVDVRSSAAQMGQLDALSIRDNAARQAYGYETQANSYTMQAGLDTMQGQAASTAGDYAGASSLLSGLSGAAGGIGKADAAGACNVPSNSSNIVQGGQSTINWNTVLK